MRFVVDAPPAIVKRPLVMVEEALERKPFVNVARPVCVVAPEIVREPKEAVCENRFVEDATVEKKFVVVPDVRERVPKVERPVTPKVPVNVPLPPVNVPIVAVFEFKVVDVAVAK